jgi:hypothetical protein
MKPVLLIISSLLWASAAKAQTDKTTAFADTVKKYFDYPKLGEVACANAPVGIYAVTFRMGRDHLPYDIQFSNDSLTQLKELFVNAVKTSAQKIILPRSKKPYLQLCYFNAILLCNSSADSTPVSENIYSDLSKLQGLQLAGIERSFKQLIRNAEEYNVLSTVVIDHNLPANKYHTGFRNDTRGKKLTEQQKQEIEWQVQQRKRENCQ